MKDLPQGEIDAYFSQHKIVISDPVRSEEPYRPIISFSYLSQGLRDLLQKDSSFRSFKNPTAVQAAAWPFLFAGRDLVGVAETGSGKTLAFALPCLHVVANKVSTEVRKAIKGRKDLSRQIAAVVISPTRELALQTHIEMTKLTRHHPATEAVCLYGGVPKDTQRIALKSANIVVATPGRLKDLATEGAADLSGVGYLVLDEADRMLDKGIYQKFLSCPPLI